MTSAPNGCCRFSIDRDRHRRAGRQVEQRGDRRSSSRGRTRSRGGARSCRRARRRSAGRRTTTPSPVVRSSRSTFGRRRSTPASTRSSRSSTASRSRSRSVPLIGERRLVELDVPLLQPGPQDHLPSDPDRCRLRPRDERRDVDDEVAVGLRRGRPGASPVRARPRRTRACRAP